MADDAAPPPPEPDREDLGGSAADASTATPTEQKPDPKSRRTPPSWLVVTIGVVALLVVIVSIAVPASTGRGSNTRMTIMTIAFLVSFAVMLPALGPYLHKSRLWRSVAAGVGASVVATGIYLGWMQNLGSSSDEETSKLTLPSSSASTAVVVRDHCCSRRR